jgi:hypothetical protein
MANIAIISVGGADVGIALSLLWKEYAPMADDSKSPESNRETVNIDGTLFIVGIGFLDPSFSLHGHGNAL